MSLEDFAGELEVRPFRLEYKGPLHSSQATKKTDRKKEIHDIRRAFHEQLKRPWKSNEVLRMASRLNFRALPFRGQVMDLGDGRPRRQDPDWAVTKRHKNDRDIYFIPLVIRAARMALTCELKIHMGWREKKQGGILEPTPEGFDLDNRLKGLMDALTIPQDNQLPDDVSGDPEPYFLTLLEDDGFVTRIEISTDPLGLPKRQDEKDAYVEIDIQVTVHSDAFDDF